MIDYHNVETDSALTNTAGIGPSADNHSAVSLVRKKEKGKWEWMDGMYQNIEKINSQSRKIS